MLQCEGANCLPISNEQHGQVLLIVVYATYEKRNVLN